MTTPPRPPEAYDQVKRALDVVTAGALLITTSPIQAVVALTVRRRLGTPVLFRQERPGLHGKPFTLIKMRTMLDVDPAKGLVTNEQRMTGFGQRLRATSLDELPTLWNVLRGDMSIVGPRPLRMTYLERYTAHQARRHEVRPGVTGLAQVSGRNAIGWDERLDLDVEYVDRRSLRLDLSILLRTIGAVLRRDGIAHDGHATMGAFYGPTNRHGVVERRLERSDLETRVAWLNDPTVRAGVSITFDANLPDTVAWFDRVQDDPCRYDWVHHDRAGLAVAMCGMTMDGSGRAFYYLYVNPAAHGRGHGRRSLATSVDRAEQLGLEALDLEVKTDNARAIRLYRSLGFVERDDVDAPAGKLAMTRPLSRREGRVAR
ncbi:MAG: GNAT family N-acetyltransferase [Cellulomonas sp.]|uniref:GNAT family N-acetyltransferase n=1 Tax=Cellulomonas sp. TaxID=40001 RepID=UPI0019F67B7D|nr:GNAT family N-acetyltransferase [Cellulomonas sp.]MBF0689111.1 GNAT family N-acetyltransferase [Cellulomonas sp.]